MRTLQTHSRALLRGGLTATVLGALVLGGAIGMAHAAPSPAIEPAVPVDPAGSADSTVSADPTGSAASAEPTDPTESNLDGAVDTTAVIESDETVDLDETIEPGEGTAPHETTESDDGIEPGEGTESDDGTEPADPTDVIAEPADPTQAVDPTQSIDPTEADAVDPAGAADLGSVGTTDTGATEPDSTGTADPVAAPAPTNTHTTEPVWFDVEVPPTGAGDWYSGPVEIGITVVGGDERWAIEWQLSGAQGGTGSAEGSTAVVPVTADGETVVTYRAEHPDGATLDAERLTVRIDATAPVFDNDVPRLSDTGWLRMPGEVLIRADDAESDVDWVEVRTRTDGGTWSDWTRTDGSRQFVPVDTEGRHEIEHRAADTAGNVATATLRLDADFENPGITVLEPTVRAGIVQAAETFERGESVAFAFACDGGVSGTASCTATFEGEPYTAATLPTAESGAFDIEILAQDVAGNESVETFSFAVTADPTTSPGGHDPVTPGGAPGTPVNPAGSDDPHRIGPLTDADTVLASTGAIVWPWVLLVGGIFAAGVLLIGSARQVGRRRD